MADYESNSLIDWIGPVAECNNKPLIPLPSFNNPIDIAEDNPFDAVERRINENEFLDIFNINLSFDDDSKYDKAGDPPKDNVSLNVSVKENNSSSVDLVNDDLKTSSQKNEKDVSQSDLSFISSLSSLSDFKEMVQNRISSCVNQALNSESRIESFNTPSSFYHGRSALSQPSELNDCIIESSKELRGLKNTEFLNIDGECEDLQSIKLNWDEYSMSSSDEENEKPVLNNFIAKSRLCSPLKTLHFNQFEKAKDVRAPLVCQDPNIRIKKPCVELKQGPLKAVVPVSNMKKIGNRKISVVNTAVKTISSKSKVSSSIIQSKLRKWSMPVATSTPQNSKPSTPKSFKYSSTPKSSRNSSIEKQMPSTFSHPPSPDSTSDFKSTSRTNSAVRIASKCNSRKLSWNAVSSSTNDDHLRTPSKLSKDVKSNSFCGAISKMENRSITRSVRNKENLLPFRN